MKILIVDDSLLAEHALKSYFERLGHEVVGLARSAEQGKEMYKNLNPDLITVDAIMETLDAGMQYVKYINQLETEDPKSTKIIMITGDEIADEYRDTLKVDKYLVKPITLKKIKETLDEIY